MPTAKFVCGDALAVLPTLPPESVQCCICSPPYWQSPDLGQPARLGLESDPEVYIAQLVAIFGAVRRVLRPDGVLWLVLDDPHQEPVLPGIPWRVALALRADGWLLRADIIWERLAPIPNFAPCPLRPVHLHEHVFLFAKGGTYPFLGDWTDVWKIPAQDYLGTHFGTLPEELVRRCVLAGSRPDDLVLDPFGGSGTVAKVAVELGRDSLYIDIAPAYLAVAAKRVSAVSRRR